MSDMPLTREQADALGASLGLRPIPLDSGMRASDDAPRRRYIPHGTGCTSLAGYLSAPDGGAAEWRERQRQLAAGRAVAGEAAPDHRVPQAAQMQDGSASLVSDARPGRPCRFCGRTLPPQLGPGRPQVWCSDSCRKSHERARANRERMEGAGYFLPGVGKIPLRPQPGTGS